MGHALPLLERMGKPEDIAVVNFGAWHGSGEGAEFHKLMQEFTQAVAEKAEDLPHMVWKEMVPTHYDQQHGLYSGEAPHQHSHAAALVRINPCKLCEGLSALLLCWWLLC